MHDNITKCIITVLKNIYIKKNSPYITTLNCEHFHSLVHIISIAIVIICRLFITTQDIKKTYKRTGMHMDEQTDTREKDAGQHEVRKDN